MNPTIQLPAMNKIVGQTGLFNFGMATGLEGRQNLLNSTLKNLDLVLHSACNRGVE